MKILANLHVPDDDLNITLVSSVDRTLKIKHIYNSATYWFPFKNTQLISTNKVPFRFTQQGKNTKISLAKVIHEP